MYSVNLIKTEQHAAQAPALHERFYPSKSDSSELFGPEFMAKGLVTGCGSLVLKSIKRSVINIRRSICSLFNPCSAIYAPILITNGTQTRSQVFRRRIEPRKCSPGNPNTETLKRYRDLKKDN
jgi:hypothetical protein